MKVKLFVVAKIEPKITIDKHEFDSSDSDDMEALEYYLKEEGIESESMDEIDFELVCKKFLYEEEIMAWNQHFIEAIVLTEKELKQIQNFKLK